MNDIQIIVDWMDSLIQVLVDYPKDVFVKALPTSEGFTLSVIVNPVDTEKLIGREGSNAEALQQLLVEVGMVKNLKLSLDIEGQQAPQENAVR
ncbi:KH domain-containing protein [Granulicella sp. dw_53]|uniref:KH domain-containing protein n=1 Tax=Granulicella sp. dw_53 TaxID=2719792 RepID=UPI001BD5EBDB|nr:KH domain-containing protein [Granulicella sp. dw_53]